MKSVKSSFIVFNPESYDLIEAQAWGPSKVFDQIWVEICVEVLAEVCYQVETID